MLETRPPGTLSAPEFESSGRLRDLEELAGRLGQTRGLQPLTEAAVAALSEYLGDTLAVIWLCDAEGNTPAPVAAAGPGSRVRRGKAPPEVFGTIERRAPTHTSAPLRESSAGPFGDAPSVPPLAFFGYPLLAGGRVLGVLGLYRAAPLAEESDALVRVYTAHLALAVAHAQLQRLEKRRGRQAAALHRVGEALSQERHLDSLLRVIADAGLSLSGAEGVRVLIESEDRGEPGFFVLASTAGLPHRSFTDTTPARMREILSPLLDRGEVLRVSDARRDPRFGEPAGARGTASLLGAPITGRDGRVLGALLLEHRAPLKFGEQQEVVALALAEQAATALENVGLLADARKTAARARVLNQVGQVLSSILDREVLLRAIHGYVAETMDAPNFIVALWDQPSAQLHVLMRVEDGVDYGSTVVPVGGGPLSRAVLTGQPYHIKHLDEEAAQLAESMLWYGDEEEATQSLLAVPMSLRGAVVGAFSVQSLAPKAYSEADVEFLATLANQAAVALENARLYEQLEASRSKLSETLRELQETDRMKDYFISVASHELRTPLTLVRGQVQMLERDVGNPAREGKMRRRTNVVMRNVDRMGRLIEALLDATRLQTRRMPLQLAPLDLAELCRAVVEGFEGVAGEGRVVIDAPDRPVGVMGDPDRLEQVLLNLLGNAQSHSPEEGTVAVRLWAQGGAARVSVSDEGAGIAARELPKVFDRFYQAVGSDPTYHRGGLGLGLYITRGIVEAHDGRIWVESPPGEGATFTVELPLGEGQVDGEEADRA